MCNHSYISTCHILSTHSLGYFCMLYPYYHCSWWHHPDALLTNDVCSGITYVFSLKCLVPVHISVFMFWILHYFLIPGKHVSYKCLDYKPNTYSAMTSISRNHVMVAQHGPPPAVRVHQLPSGETVRTISHQELKLRGADELNGVNFTGPLLHLAVGKSISTKSLHTYKVQCNLSKLITMHFRWYSV